jgi:hypothetical protein
MPVMLYASTRPQHPERCTRLTRLHFRCITVNITRKRWTSYPCSSDAKIDGLEACRSSLMTSVDSTTRLRKGLKVGNSAHSHVDQVLDYLRLSPSASARLPCIGIEVILLAPVFGRALRGISAMCSSPSSLLQYSYLFLNATKQRFFPPQSC